MTAGPRRQGGKGVCRAFIHLVRFHVFAAFVMSLFHAGSHRR